jgi:hypothetical protein
MPVLHSSAPACWRNNRSLPKDAMSSIFRPRTRMAIQIRTNAENLTAPDSLGGAG